MIQVRVYPKDMLKLKKLGYLQDMRPATLASQYIREGLKATRARKVE
jgi:hypothetical protein